MDYLEFQSLRHSEELYHHGIEGQKWGVRRFQNDDGSLTPAGKERYYGNGTGTRGIQRQRARSVHKMEKKVNKLQADIDSFKGLEKTGVTTSKGKTVLTPDDVKNKVSELKDKQQRAELTNEYRQKVLDVKASKTAGGRFVNFLFGGLGGNLAISSMELKGNSRATALGKEYVGTALASLLTGAGGAVINPYIYMSNRDEYINEKMNKK